MMTLIKKFVPDLTATLRNGVKDPAYAAQCIAYPFQCVLQQQATIPDNNAFPVPVYKTVDEIDAKQRKLKWVPDPRMDLVRHPRFMEEAAAKHPDYAGDCDDFAVHRCCALVKGGLAEEVWMAAVVWKEDAHAVCVFRTKDSGWWWASNWNGCKPLALKQRDDFVDAVIHYGVDAKPRALTNAAAWPVVKVLPDDTVLLGPPTMVR